jgi:hypothetical protein
MSDAKVEKRTGWDWTVVFRNPDDGEIIPASIFGVVGMQKVVENAYNDTAMPEDWDIIAIIRQDQSEAVLKEVY